MIFKFLEASLTLIIGPADEMRQDRRLLRVFLAYLGLTVIKGYVMMLVNSQEGSVSHLGLFSALHTVQ